MDISIFYNANAYNNFISDGFLARARWDLY